MSFGRDRKEPLSDSTKLDYMAVLMMIFLYGYQIKRLVSVMLHYALLSMLVLLSFFAYFVVHRKSICQPITEVSDLHICSYPLWIIDQMYTERNSSIWGNCVSCSHDSLLKCDFRNTAVLEDYSFLICSKHHVTRSCGTSLVAPWVYSKMVSKSPRSRQDWVREDSSNSGIVVINGCRFYWLFNLYGTLVTSYGKQSSARQSTPSTFGQ